MTRRAIFLDIDGTYAHHGRVPAAHADAVRAARAAGHLVLLCTGRPLSLIPPHLREAGFDGIVAAAGAHVTVADEVLVDTRFPAGLAARAVEALDAHGALFFLEGPEATHARPAAVEAMREYRERHRRGSDGATDLIAALTVAEDLTGVAFGKITTLHAASPVHDIAAAIGPEVAVIPSSIPDLGPGAGEIYLADVHKAVGIAAVVAHLGLSRDDVVACGDGLNDLEMLAYAGTAVAIEGAAPALIALADHIAAPPTREGLAAAFVELGLIA